MDEHDIVLKVGIDEKTAQKDLDKLKRDIDKTMASLNENKAKKSGIEQQLNTAKEAAKATEDEIRRLQAELDKTDPSKLGAVGGPNMTGTLNAQPFLDRAANEEELQRQTALLAQQDKETERIANQYVKITDAVREQEAHLASATDRAGQLAAQLAGAGSNADNAAAAEQGAADGANETADGVSNIATAGEIAQASMEKLANRIKGLAKRVFIFSMITMALRSLRKWLGNVMKGNEEAQAAMAKLRGSLYRLAAPIMEVVIPAFVMLLKIINSVVSTAANIVGSIFGKTAEQSEEAAKALKDETDAISSVGGAAKDAGKAMASFDTVNVLSAGESGGGGASAGGVDFTGEAMDGIQALAQMLVGVALIAVGLCLVLSAANIPIGLAMIIAGALAVYGAVKENWGEIQKKLQGPLGAIIALASAALLALGIILVCAGVIPLGVALIAAGAMGLAAVIAANWDSIIACVRNPLNAILLLIVGVMMLAVGLILACSGVSLPVGLAMIAAGAALMVGVAAANWDRIVAFLKSPLGAIVGMLVGGVLLAVGLILCLSGVGILIGLAMMAAGAAVLGYTAYLNWDKIKDITSQVLDFIKEHALVAALLAIGIILCLSGVGIPIGLAMIGAAVTTWGTPADVDWNIVKKKVMEAWESLKNWWNEHIAPIFTKEYWQKKANLIAAGFTSGLTASTDGTLQWTNDVSNIVDSSMPSAGSNAALGFKEGLMSGDSGATAFADGVVSDAKSTLQINSPSRVFAELGKYCLDGFVNGWSDNFGAYKACLDTLLELTNETAHKCNLSAQDELRSLLLFFTGVFVIEFQTALTGVTDAFRQGMNGVLGYAELTFNRLIISMNKILEQLNTMMSMMAALSGTAFTPVPAMPSISIPRLAMGAVIPPNREFLAVLGDQKSGTNIEAPLDTIVQAFRMALREGGAGGNNTAVMEVDGTTFAKLIYKLNNQEQSRVGVSFAGGVV